VLDNRHTNRERLNHFVAKVGQVCTVPKLVAKGLLADLAKLFPKDR
jgi:hypothetical protein